MFTPLSSMNAWWWHILENHIYAIPPSTPRKRTKPMEVLCVGPPRSGTESLQKALLTLGYDHTYHGWDIVYEDPPIPAPGWVKLARKKWYGSGKNGQGDCSITADEFDELIGHCTAVTDAAASCFAAEMIRAYPDAKVVLNVRRDLDRWHESAVKTLVHVNESWSFWVASLLDREAFWAWHVYERFLWALFFRAPDGDMAGAIKRNGKWIYREHCDMIRGLVPPERLLEWSVDEGWEPLCAFLGKEVPKTPFPHANATGSGGGWKMREEMAIKRWIEGALTNLILMGIVFVGGAAVWMRYGSESGGEKRHPPERPAARVMEAPIAAAVRRKPLPGQLPGPPPMPPPPDFDPFPSRRPVLRGARSTPNLRDSAVPSVYDPPPAYEEFPGVNSSGRLNIIPPSPGRLPSPAPPSPGPVFPGPPACAETFNEPRYRPYRPPASPVSPVSPMSSVPPPPSKSESSYATSQQHVPPPPSFPPQKSETFSVGTHQKIPPPPPFPPPQNAATFPVAAHYVPSPSPGFAGPPASETFPLSGPRPPVSPVYAPSEAPSADSQTKEKTFWQTALDETKYFAGGLISHPFEYTKHHAILRHSTALVWYRGPSTSVTVTIFSDAPLPPTRTLWLQRKGFSGNMGMNLKSLVGANDSWLDVTPSAQATPSDMPDGDERGCQRDIKKFLKKAPKNLSKHLPRETHVVRIPAAADDGYFRLVLCTGGGGDAGKGKRKVLCPSPVFRIASTSTDASVVRGASFASMPIELGIKAGSIVATTVANRYIGPAAAVVQARTKKLQTAKFVTKHATHIATAKSGIDKSGIKTTVTAYEEQYATTRGAGYAPWQEDGAGEVGFEEAPPEVVGPDDGPVDPFPIKFDGRIVRGTGRGGMELGIPTANLADVPEDVRMRMRGVYFGWARVVPRSGLEHVSTEWHESIITVGPAPYATPRVAAKNVATVHLIHEFGGALFLETRLKVLVMGQLRLSTPAVGSEAALAAYGTDVLLAVASLSRENWGPVETRERMRTMRSEMSLSDRYMETRERVQKQVDRIPVHLAGVRTEGAALRDRAYGNGGIWVPR
ncbi:hypothetical protein CkaCkLH20_09584 [Colletotrichum karsti]|uniref:riboflavin kinase n=1 Tax=Colletotrichum karsti TaxID=1095194 RepID=A0A9P6LEE8_9PEZI|nr:uncharacterized protein CkaCkLH20_09584 [Colletotrichum karsti]KAF9873074.1 hypothetical protein CkaCkLH20_09584 [Colletotrichum karsti]